MEKTILDKKFDVLMDKFGKDKDLVFLIENARNYANKELDLKKSIEAYEEVVSSIKKWHGAKFTKKLEKLTREDKKLIEAEKKEVGEKRKKALESQVGSPKMSKREYDSFVRAAKRIEDLIKMAKSVDEDGFEALMVDGEEGEDGETMKRKRKVEKVFLDIDPLFKGGTMDIANGFAGFIDDHANMLVKKGIPRSVALTYTIMLSHPLAESLFDITKHIAGHTTTDNFEDFVRALKESGV